MSHAILIPIHAPTGIAGGFGTQLFGDARQPHTRQKLALLYPSPRLKVCIPYQSHSLTICTIQSDTDVNSVNADALITTVSDTILAVYTADCVPIIYWDKSSGVIGISHQGWKGTLGKLPSLVIKSMCAQGAQKETIHCDIGPCIGACCYRIYGTREEKFRKEFSNAIIHTTSKGNFLDLAKANSESLMHAGIKKNNITFHNKCTAHNPDMFFSYHRSGSILGEMMNYVVRHI